MSTYENRKPQSVFSLDVWVQDSPAARVLHSLTGMLLSTRIRLSRDQPLVVPSSSNAHRTCNGQRRLLMGFEARQ